MVENIPFNLVTGFAANKLVSDLLLRYNTNYISNLDFNYEPDSDELYKFNVRARRVDSAGIQEAVTFKMTSDVFNTINYIDSYMFDMVMNNYELSMASVTGRSGEEPSELIIVDKVDRIVAMAQIKNSSSCGIEFVVVDGNDNKYTLLSTFNLGITFNKKKFKGMTVDRLQNVYMQESDQYLQLFSNFCKFANVDKEYLIVKAKNKDEVSKLFLLDSTVRTEFESMIGEY